MNAPRISRIALAALLLALAACSQQPPVKSRPTPNPRPWPKPVVIAPPAPRPELGTGDSNRYYSANTVTGDYAGYPALERFIDRMVSRHGFSRTYLNGLFSQARRKQWTLDYLSRETKPGAAPRPGAWTRYRAKFLTERHISTGAAFWAKHSRALSRAHSEYGVDPEHILGIMGVETLYGGNLGSHRIIDALTTLAFDYPRRAEYFTGELENFLVMAREERINPSRPVGSYAGAMGLGQFMPSSFLEFAVDFDHDGRRDLWNPVDAIGSIAHYFAGHGWRPGEAVVVPAIVTRSSVDGLECGFDTRYSLATLADYGIRPTAGVPRVDRIRLLRLSTNHGDEYWLGLDNFYVITRYNHSTHYAMAVHQLAGAIKQRYLQRVALLE